MISLDTPLRELMLLGSSVVDVLERYGLACASCMGAEFETLHDACVAHNLDGQALLIELNAAHEAGATRNGDVDGQ